MPTKSNQATKSQRYLYSVGWSERDRAFIARVAEFPSLSAHGDSPEAALREIRFVVEAVIEDMEQSSERIPGPIGSRLRPPSDVGFEAHCAINIQDERRIQRGMRITGKSRETIIAEALAVGLKQSERELSPAELAQSAAEAALYWECVEKSGLSEAEFKAKALRFACERFESFGYQWPESEQEQGERKKRA